MAGLNWSDSDEIGYQLHEKFPALDPLQVRFTELRQHVLELDEFAGSEDASSEKALEAIQMAWLSYHQADE